MAKSNFGVGVGVGIEASEGTSNHPNNIEQHRSHRKVERSVFYLFVGAGIALLTLHGHDQISSAMVRKMSTESRCSYSFGNYDGPTYNLAGVTSEPWCLLQSRWLRVMKHSVKVTSTGEDGSEKESTVDDWVWIDYHDRVNVLVQAPPSELSGAGESDEPKFLVFRQTKYGLEGKNSLAVVGGLVEPGEVPELAAKRETEEEMKLRCETLVNLGRFTTDVNRGLGHVHSFIAQDCVRVNENDEAGIDDEPDQESSDVIGGSDYEKQEILEMSYDDLRKAIYEQKFLEVQWANTVASALLHPNFFDLAASRTTTAS